MTKKTKKLTNGLTDPKKVMGDFPLPQKSPTGQQCVLTESLHGIHADCVSQMDEWTEQTEKLLEYLT